MLNSGLQEHELSFLNRVLQEHELSLLNSVLQEHELSLLKCMLQEHELSLLNSKRVRLLDNLRLVIYPFDQFPVHVSAHIKQGCSTFLNWERKYS